jgi:hypothetical protein
MSNALLGLRVWFVTVALTVVFTCLLLLFEADTYLSWDAIGAVFFMLIAGVIVGLPFLLLTIMLIAIAKRLPYSGAGRLVWVFVVNSIFVLLYYETVGYLLDGKFGIVDEFSRTIAGTTIAAYLVSLWFNRRGFQDKPEAFPASPDATDATPTPINSAS